MLMNNFQQNANKVLKHKHFAQTCAETTHAPDQFFQGLQKNLGVATKLSVF